MEDQRSRGSRPMAGQAGLTGRTGWTGDSVELESWQTLGPLDRALDGYLVSRPDFWHLHLSPPELEHRGLNTHTHITH